MIESWNQSGPYRICMLQNLCLLLLLINQNYKLRDFSKGIYKIYNPVKYSKWKPTFSFGKKTEKKSVKRGQTREDPDERGESIDRDNGELSEEIRNIARQFEICWCVWMRLPLHFRFFASASLFLLCESSWCQLCFWISIGLD